MPDTATDVQPCPYRPFSTLTLHLQDDDPSLTSH